MPAFKALAEADVGDREELLALPARRLPPVHPAEIHVVLEAEPHILGHLPRRAHGRREDRAVAAERDLQARVQEGPVRKSMIGRSVIAQLPSEKRVDWCRISISIPPATGRSSGFGTTKVFRSLKPPP
jgi:hypothetical protein